MPLGVGTVIVAHVAFTIPFVAVVVLARLRGMDRSLEEAALVLGADEATAFRRITLPLLAPGILAGALLAFTLSLDDFVITFFVAGPGLHDPARAGLLDGAPGDRTDHQRRQRRPRGAHDTAPSRWRRGWAGTRGA